MNKFIYILGVISVLSLGFWGCQVNSQGQSAVPAQEKQTTPQGHYVNIDVKAAYQKIQEDSNVVVIDVRTPAEFTGELGHIPGAILRPLQTIDQWAPEAKQLREQNKKIILVCRSGHRSGIATQTLAKMGLDSLFNVQGGMQAWNAAGLPVEK